VYLLCIAGVATVVEAVTPFGLDNLSVPFVVALMYWAFLVG
jgi:dolichol kinase